MVWWCKSSIPNCDWKFQVTKGSSWKTTRCVVLEGSLSQSGSSACLWWSSLSWSGKKTTLHVYYIYIHICIYEEFYPKLCQLLFFGGFSRNESCYVVIWLGKDLELLSSLTLWLFPHRSKPQQQGTGAVDVWWKIQRIFPHKLTEFTPFLHWCISRSHFCGLKFRFGSL